MIIEKGFESTSTSDIAERAKIARGTLYHYFKSKDQILDILVSQALKMHLTRAKTASLDKSVSVVERLLKTILSLQMKSSYEEILLNHLNDPGNLVLHNLIQKEMIEEIPGIFTEIIKDGIEEGIFITDFPYEVMEMFVIYLNVIVDGELELTLDEKYKKVKSLLKNLEKMLGAKSGTLDPIRDFFGIERG